VDDGGIVRLWNASAEQILLAAQIDSGGLRLDREGFDAAELARR
jgi:hypothetical protein